MVESDEALLELLGRVAVESSEENGENCREVLFDGGSKQLVS